MRKFNVKAGLLLITCICFVLFGHAQSMKISGQVISEQGTPLQGVSVTVKGRTTGVSTDAEGNFTLDAAAGDILVISSVGYNNAEHTVGTEATVMIVLTTAESSKLDEVVVVGYGTAKRSKITSSISKLDNKVLESGLRSNPAQALAGTIPGLRVSTGTGRPGSLPSIILRGGTNFDGSGSPLILMDGQVRGSLSDINPEDIASMEVLKDASATAIYGARASNGVILITSKRGKAGQSSINIDVKRGTSYLNVPYNF
ncbi:MAG TPA: carboxypeptidase-like regulatory domain-containing protein, partial [Agriterribacter sp.]|nr:carboxypeptidase-like regulatory domain-containing protein [Agriterribacter sp.]